MMLQAGKCVYKAGDELKKVTPEYLWRAVKNPKSELEAAIRQLRMVKNMDEKRYQALKRDLPYVVCGIFYPPVRKTENFAWISHFIIDIDHLSVKETTPAALKEKLKSDNRILMMFISPGDDGLKIMFRLNEKMYDAAKFSWFYKAFLSSFSRQYDLQQVADSRTSDVTRACFLSADPDAWYNESAEPVVPEQFVQFDNFLEMKELKTELTAQEKEARAAEPRVEKPDIEQDALDKIKATLNPKFFDKKKKPIYVPEEAESVVEMIIEQMNSKEIATSEVSSIHYGKKFKFSLGFRQAEVNLFYGKRGYTVVISPRNGTDAEFNQVCWQIISEMLT